MDSSGGDGCTVGGCSQVPRTATQQAKKPRILALEGQWLATGSSDTRTSLASLPVLMLGYWRAVQVVTNVMQIHKRQRTRESCSCSAVQGGQKRSSPRTAGKNCRGAGGNKKGNKSSTRIQEEKGWEGGMVRERRRQRGKGKEKSPEGESVRPRVADDRREQKAEKRRAASAQWGWVERFCVEHAVEGKGERWVVQCGRERFGEKKKRLMADARCEWKRASQATSLALSQTRTAEQRRRAEQRTAVFAAPKWPLVVSTTPPPCLVPGVGRTSWAKSKGSRARHCAGDTVLGAASLLIRGRAAA